MSRVTAKNPFDDDADDDYLRNPAAKSPEVERPENDEFNYYQQQIDSILGSTLESTGRSLRLLDESEQIGVHTAEDLLSQGEKLRNVDQKLDEMHATTKETQKHLNGIKSIFGGFKNYFSKPAAAPSTQAAKGGSDDTANSKLGKTVGQMKGASSPFDDDELDSSGGVKKSKSTGGLSTSGGGSAGGSLAPSSAAYIKGTKWEAVDAEIDENLDLMSAHLRRIRDLGSALGSEIDTQNQVIDKISEKTSKQDIVIRDQDRQMKGILGVKKPPAGAAAPATGAGAASEKGSAASGGAAASGAGSKARKW